MENEEKTLDIDRILAAKAGKKARLVPRFVVNWLKRIVHEDELNVIIRNTQGIYGYRWCKACMDYMQFKVEVKGMENLPASTDPRRFTLVSNHPLGGPDGVALGAIVGEYFDDNFRYLVNDLLMNLPGLAPLCIPINKTGKQSRDFPEKVRQAFASDHHIMMFPAGLCSRLIDGKIQDLPWTKTFIQKSVETHRDIIPVHFEGRNSNRFYRIANICKALRLKFNVAMLFLSDEMFLNKGKTFSVTFGKPIPWQTFDRSKSTKEWAQVVRGKVYELD